MCVKLFKLATYYTVITCFSGALIECWSVMRVTGVRSMAKENHKYVLQYFVYFINLLSNWYQFYLNQQRAFHKQQIKR